MGACRTQSAAAAAATQVARHLPAGRLHLYLFKLFTFLLLACCLTRESHLVLGQQSCGANWNLDTIQSRDKGRCPGNSAYLYPNVPLLSAAFCFNNGTGLCKAVAGRFEFLFNSSSGQFLGPAPAGRWVDGQGFHERVPVAYTPKGNLLYFDRALQWARKFSNSLGRAASKNLLSARSFNWCPYAIENLWPYKSALVDHDQVHVIYFFNRQTCVHNRRTGSYRFYNTRFQAGSNQLLDYDLNPIIFAMQDLRTAAGGADDQLRLVMHKRLHWRESSWKLTLQADQSHRLELTPAAAPCRLCGDEPLFSKAAYEATSDKCVDDNHLKRAWARNQLADSCGLSQRETAVLMPNGRLLEIAEHNGQLWRDATTFNYLNGVSPSGSCLQFDSTSTSYIASTYDSLGAKRDKTNESRILTLRTDDNRNGRSSGDVYPLPVLEIRKASWAANQNSWKWTAKGIESVASSEINYVDDFVYLDECKTIVTIFGPLYTEHPADRFGLEEKAPIGPISDLGADEPVNAATAGPESDLFLYMRTNYIMQAKYTCRSTPSDLTTAVKQGKYFTRFGAGARPEPALKLFPPGNNKVALSEERLFADLGLYAGSAAFEEPDAPSARRFPLEDPDVPNKGVPAWVWVLALIGLLVVVAMVLACVLHYRRRRYVVTNSRSFRLPPTSQLASVITKRSAASYHGASHGGQVPSASAAVAASRAPTSARRTSGPLSDPLVGYRTARSSAMTAASGRSLSGSVAQGPSSSARLAGSTSRSLSHSHSHGHGSNSRSNSSTKRSKLNKRIDSEN